MATKKTSKAKKSAKVVKKVVKKATKPTRKIATFPIKNPVPPKALKEINAKLDDLLVLVRQIKHHQSGEVELEQSSVSN